MPHARQQVRAAAAGLLTAAPTNWQRVFQSRAGPARDVLPYLLAYVGAETIEPLDIHPGHLQYRDMTLSVRGRIRDIDGEETETALDALASEIEATLTFAALKAALPKLKNMQLVSVAAADDGTEEYERTYAEIALDWQVRVHTIEGSPETLV